MKMSISTTLAAQGGPRSAEPTWLSRWRDQARSHFEATGLPGRKSEDYKYTDLSRLNGLAFKDAPAAIPDLARELNRVHIGLRQVPVVNGQVPEEALATLQLPPGVSVRSMRAVLEQEPARLEGVLGGLAPADLGPLYALNAAHFKDGLLIEVEAGVRLSEPLQIVQVTDGGGEAIAAFPRDLIVAHEGARVSVVTAHVGAGGPEAFVCGVTEVVAHARSEVELYRLQEDGPGVTNLGHAVLALHEEARVHSFDLSSSGRLSRQEVRAELLGEHAEVGVNGLYLGSGRDQRDVHVVIDHKKPHCKSDQLFRGVLDDHSTGTFNGIVIVREGADFTDAQQSNKSLLMSENAHAHTRPQLEIYADEVAASHGATVGQLDADALFYLRSRGLPEEQARSLLTRAFAREVFERIPDRELLPHLEDVLTRVLHLAEVPEGEA